MVQWQAKAFTEAGNECAIMRANGKETIHYKLKQYPNLSSLRRMMVHLEPKTN